MSALHLAAPAAENAAKSTSAPTVSTGPDRDREIARAMMAAVRQLNDVMDEAIKAGLVIEPSISLAQNRFEDIGVSATSYIVSVKMFRKLC